MFTELLFAAITLTAPADGATAEILSEAQRSYLALPRAERLAKFDDGAFRKALAKDGDGPQSVRLEWKGDTNQVYLLAVEDSIFAVSNRCYARITNLEPGKTYGWSVRIPGEFDNVSSSSFTVAPTLPRLMYAEGVHNLRDCGGWKGVGGRRVRFGRLFRSAGLRNSARKSGDSLLNVRYSPGGRRVTDSGLAALKDDLGIKTDIELRSLKEAMCMKSSLIPEARWVHVPFLAYDFIDDDVKGRLQFVKIFRQLLKEENYPVLFHCSGGRDRTGTVSFLLLGLLGVAEDDLLRDWEATAFGDSALSFGSSRIIRLLDYLATRHGKDINARIENYVRSCGISEKEIAAFRELMLEGGAR